MYTFINKRVRLEYEVTGWGKPLVFLHGMGGSINQVYSVYEEIEGVRLIVMNQQGHGGSEADWQGLDFDRLGDDVTALLDHLGIKRALFAGISMGAAVSLNIAVRYPRYVEKLLLIRNAWTDRPMSEEVQTAYFDMGRALQDGGENAFRQSEGWRIVREASAYTRNAFLSPFQDAASIEKWQKYLILPKKTPIASVEELERITSPVTILANRNDLCHPYTYGKYIHMHIKESVFVEIPDKDTDGAAHKQMINQAVRRMAAAE